MYRASKYLFNGVKKEGCWVPYTVCLPMIKIVRVCGMRLEGEEGRGKRGGPNDRYLLLFFHQMEMDHQLLSSLPLSACLSAMHACCQ